MFFESPLFGNYEIEILVKLILLLSPADWSGLNGKGTVDRPACGPTSWSPWVPVP